MIFEKTIAAVAAGAAIVAAVAVSVVSAAFALYALLLPHLGAAGASACLAAAFALLAFLGYWLAARKAEGRRHREDEPIDAGLLGRILEMAKERPLLAAGAAIAAGVFVLRNPAVLTAIVTAFVAGEKTPPPKR